ncbi:MAG: hypothetical protein RBS05_18805 [Zoogloea oleivorans]|jgi:hypothetical protein|uniref:hypothetical protein n=1 Tax=Zoogloea oleivorans TaxID=1552750 RepID=UPI002A364658|nr:hypothetical protein [Zoogloea oleivorans]MDY0037966.1 hypothetical protein [Zoogloea oleivorans]
MQLYRRIEQGKRVRYEPWTERYRGKLDLEDAELMTILSGLVVGLLIQVEEHYPAHSRLKREIVKVENAVVSMARAAGTVNEPSAKMVTIATLAWNSAIQAMEEALTQ